MGTRRKIVCMDDGQVYPTMAAAERAYDISSGMLSEAMKFHRPVHGIRFRFQDEIEAEERKREEMAKVREAQAKLVEEELPMPIKSEYDDAIMKWLKDVKISYLRKYKYVIAWCYTVHSTDDIFLNIYLKEAKEHGCPKGGVFRRDGDRWAMYEEIDNKVTLKMMEKPIKHVEKRIEELRHNG